MRAGRDAEAIDYLSRDEMRENQTGQRLLLLAYRRQGRHRESERLARVSGRRRHWPSKQAGLMGEGAGPAGGLGVLTRMLMLQSSKKRKLEWSDWRDLLPLTGQPEMKISTR